ncbi:serine/threonine-protein kinase PAK 1-like [Bolinopsis microptera]|uniref:serine/threonine-protein kinase PAK 1-like n=1 Tax=Bolinopsis microptera TaxID=2820187 RepID=UPI00307A49E8
MTDFSTTADTGNSPRDLISFSAYQRSQNGSVSYLIINRIKTKLGDFYDEIDEVLTGFRGSGLCQNAPETLSDEEEEEELGLVEEAELGVVGGSGEEGCGGSGEEGCGGMYRDVVTVCHSTRTYSPTIEEELQPESEQCFDIVDNLACQQNRTDSDSDSYICESGDDKDLEDINTLPEVSHLGTGGEEPVNNIRSTDQHNQTSIDTMCSLKEESPTKNNAKQDRPGDHLTPSTNSNNQNFEFEMISTCFDSEESENRSQVPFSTEKHGSKEKSPSLLSKDITHEVDSMIHRTDPKLIRHPIPTNSSADQAKYRQTRTPVKAPPPPKSINLTNARKSSPEYFEASSHTPSPGLPASSPVQFIRILSRSPRPGSQFANGNSVSSEHFSLHSSENSANSMSFTNPFFHQSNSKLGEFFTNFNNSASPVTKFLNDLSSPKPETSHQSTFTKLSRNKHCVLSRDWSDYSAEEAGFNMNNLTETGYISVGKTGPERYTKIREIGEGGFGTVYLAQDTTYWDKVVLKEMELGRIQLEDIAEEILDRYPHENIMKLLDHYSTFTHYCMVYEFQSQVSLFDYLRLAGKQNEFEGKVILRQVVNALDWLHDNMIVHGDLKDENMIIQSKTKNIILIDFGSARMIKEKYEPFRFRGTRVYSPPEAVVGDMVFGQSLDVWTVGTFVYVLLNNRRPFVDDQEILNACLPYPKNWSDGAKDFVRQCLTRNYLDRPSIKFLKYHPWIQS